jgi:hypothetical protein
MAGMHHSTQHFIGWDEISWTFCPGWPWTVILLISTSWVARIISVLLHAQLLREEIWGYKVGSTEMIFGKLSVLCGAFFTKFILQSLFHNSNFFAILN